MFMKELLKMDREVAEEGSLGILERLLKEFLKIIKWMETESCITSMETW